MRRSTHNPRGGYQVPDQQPQRIQSNATKVYCPGNGFGCLIPYTGPLSDAALRGYAHYRLFPTCVSTICCESIQEKLREEDVKQSAAVALKPGVRWKVQFGAQIVYFGRERGLGWDCEKQFTNKPLPEAKLEKLLDGPRRTTFTARDYADLDGLVSFLVKETGAQVAKHEHNLLFQTKSKVKRVVRFERSAATRGALLDGKTFTVDGFYDESRCGNFVFVLPAADDAAPPDQYTLVRALVVEKTETAKEYQHLSVCVRTVDDTVSVEFIDGVTVTLFTRVQEKYVLQMPESTTEIHVVKNEEIGSTVTVRPPPVCVELHNRLTQGQPSVEMWEEFLVQAMKIEDLLRTFGY